MSYRLEFSESALSRLELLGGSDDKQLRHVILKTLSLRRNPFPQDTKKLVNFNYQGLAGYRVNQGEYRIIYAVDEANKKVLIGAIINRNEDYKRTVKK